MEITESRILLGQTDLQVSPMGLGAWQWGDRTTWSYGGKYGEDDVRAAFEASLAAGINFFDTAELYGMGASERMMGKFVADRRSDLVIASKFLPMPYRWTKAALRRALKGSLRRLAMEQLDLYQIHFPFPPVAVETWAAALADAAADGLVRAVGVSNYNEDQMRRTHAVLAQRGVPLASNQVPYSLLDRQVELNGLMKACNELGVALIAYSPIAQGALTGKYTPDKPMPGMRGRRFNRTRLENIQPLILKMREIGEAHGSKTPSQVALNWLICKGTLPIPGAKNLRQAHENAGALGWRLDADEVAALDDLSRRVNSASSRR